MTQEQALEFYRSIKTKTETVQEWIDKNIKKPEHVSLTAFSISDIEGEKIIVCIRRKSDPSHKFIDIAFEKYNDLIRTIENI
jgi:hypothetical protein